ncbi:MAG: GtrA family protein [Desulfovibrionales bacterium]|nr:MAG: GtrA family protein [Desulfovibrionales bacterium]
MPVGESPRTALHQLLRQFLTFTGVGAIGTGIHYLTLILAVSGFGLAPTTGTGIGAAIGALTNYVLNRRITFRSTCRHCEAMPKFLITAASSLVLNVIIVGLLTHVGLHYLLAQVIATCAVLVVNYLVARFWIFR